MCAPGLRPGRLGLAKGQNLAFISDNRPHLYMGFGGAKLGGVPIPLYQDAVAPRCLRHAGRGVAFAFAENQEQVDKLLEVRETVPGIRHIIYDDPRGLRNYDQPG
jgi:long-chain acyl-CoA synthetase